MPQSLARILVHLIFSTKKREPLLRDEIRPQVHGYMAAILKEMGCHPVLIQSARDHVHVLFSLLKNEALIAVVEKVKKRSSKWIKTKGVGYKAFAWQSGHAAFSVSPSRLKETEAYLRAQEEHHRKASFQEELRRFLKKHDVAYDERYIWD